MSERAGRLLETLAVLDVGHGSSAVSGSMSSGIRARAAKRDHVSGVRSRRRSKRGHGVSSKRMTPSW